MSKYTGTNCSKKFICDIVSFNTDLLDAGDGIDGELLEATLQLLVVGGSGTVDHLLLPPKQTNMLMKV